MNLNSAAISSLPKEAEYGGLDTSAHETIVMFIERGTTDRIGWLCAFDELTNYLGRIS